MLPSKKAIRKLKTLPFYGRAMQYFTPTKYKPFISFSIKVIERKKYLVVIGNTSTERENNFITVMNKEGNVLTLLPNGRWSVTINHFIYDRVVVYDDECISRFFKDCNENNYQSFIKHYCLYKTEQRKLHLRERQLLENEKWGNNFSKIPRKFRYWCNKEYGYKVIFNTNDRNTGFCTNCKKKIVFSEKLIVGHKYKCPNCKKALAGDTFKKNKSRRYKCFAMLDLWNERLVVRHFDLSEKVTALYNADNSVIGIDVTRNFLEYERDLFNTNLDCFNYYTNKFDVTTSIRHWVNSKPSIGNHMFFTLPYRYYGIEKVYKRNFSNIRSYVSENANNVLDAILYSDLSNKCRLEDLLLYKNVTLLAEKLEKAGLLALSKNVLDSELLGWYSWNFPKITENMSINEFLGFNKRFIRYAIANDMNYRSIQCMQSYNKVFKDKFEDFVLVDEYCKSNNLNAITTIPRIVDFCSDYETTINQVVSYLSKQGESIDKLKDYVSMYLKAYKLSNPTEFTVIKYSKSFLFPQSLSKAYDNAEEWLNVEKDKSSKDDIRIKNNQLKKIVEIFDNVDGKKIGDYKFTLPHLNTDFIQQGIEMHNCVGRKIYFDNMCNGLSIICFVSKQDNNYGTVEFSLRGNKTKLVQARSFVERDISCEISSELKQLELLLKNSINNKVKVVQL